MYTLLEYNKKLTDKQKQCVQLEDDCVNVGQKLLNTCISSAVFDHYPSLQESTAYNKCKFKWCMSWAKYDTMLSEFSLKPGVT